jgi:hypothetical protein
MSSWPNDIMIPWPFVLLHLMCATETLVACTLSLKDNDTTAKYKFLTFDPVLKSGLLV